MERPWSFAYRKLLTFQKKIQYRKNARLCRNFQRLLNKTCFVRLLIIDKILQKKDKQNFPNTLIGKKYQNYLRILIQNILWVFAISPFLEKEKNYPIILTNKKSAKIYESLYTVFKESFVDHIVIIKFSNFFSKKNKYWFLSNVLIEKKFFLNWLKKQNKLSATRRRRCVRGVLPVVRQAPTERAAKPLQQAPKAPKVRLRPPKVRPPKAPKAPKVRPPKAPKVRLRPPKAPKAPKVRLRPPKAPQHLRCLRPPRPRRSPKGPTGLASMVGSPALARRSAFAERRASASGEAKATHLRCLSCFAEAEGPDFWLSPRKRRETFGREEVFPQKSGKFFPSNILKKTLEKIGSIYFLNCQNSTVIVLNKSKRKFNQKSLKNLNKNNEELIYSKNLKNLKILSKKMSQYLFAIEDFSTINLTMYNLSISRIRKKPNSPRRTTMFGTRRVRRAAKPLPRQVHDLQVAVGKLQPGGPAGDLLNLAGQPGTEGEGTAADAGTEGAWVPASAAGPRAHEGHDGRRSRAAPLSRREAQAGREKVAAALTGSESGHPWSPEDRQYNKFPLNRLKNKKFYNFSTKWNKFIKFNQERRNFCFEYNGFLILSLKEKRKITIIKKIVNEYIQTCGLNIKIFKNYSLRKGINLLGWFFYKKKSNFFYSSISSANLYSHQKEIKKYLNSSSNYQSIDKIVYGLNRKILNWQKFYNCSRNDSKTLSKMNNYVFWRIWYWIKKRHLNKSSKWLYTHYWKKSESKKWTFSINNETLIFYIKKDLRKRN